MAETLDPRFTDKRTVARQIRTGQLDEKAYERYLKSLPDVAEKAAAAEAIETEEAEDEPAAPAGE